MALDVDVQGFFRLGEQLAQAHDDRNALRVFRRYTQLAPEDAHGWANRAAVAARLGVLNEQEPCLLRAIALAPNSPHYRVRLG